MKKLLLFAALLAVSSVASATYTGGWVQIIDPDTTDGAINPAHINPQDPGTIEAWVQDLLNVQVSLAGQIDNYNGHALYGLAPGVIALHYGGGPSVLSEVAYGCLYNCGTFDPPNTFNGYGISNERFYVWCETPPPCLDCTPGQQNVPEPGPLALMGAGLLGLGFTRKFRA